MRNFRFLIPVLIVIGMVGKPVSAQTSTEGKSISTKLFGLFFEDINYAADGGLYAEMVQNRSFEYAPHEKKEWNPLSYWEYESPGFSIGRLHVRSENPIHENNPTYIVIDAEFIGDFEQFKGVPGVGIKNYGFDGMIVKAGESYNFSMFTKLFEGETVDILVRLLNPEGETLATNTLQTSAKEWQKNELQLTASASSDSASVSILIQSPGVVAIDMVSLFPENTFKNRPNGLRNDMAQILADLKPKFLRFPGGCLAHGDGIGNLYLWKNTIGPVETRKAQRNIWGYHQTTGLGYFEYFQFSEDIGAKPIPIIPAGVSCQNSGGTHVIGSAGQKAICMVDMDEYVEDVLDLIEWANGPVTSEWGAKRAEAGHPAPFNLEYIGVGNEDKMTPEFEARFKMIYKAITEKHPEITVIGTSGPGSDGVDFEKGWEIANELEVPIVDEHYYQPPQWFIANQHRYDGYDRSASKVYLGEYASWGSSLFNALAEALYMTSLERNADIVEMASYAPLLAKKGFTQWRTDLIYFDNTDMVLTPNYYVQKMFMNNQGDRLLEQRISSTQQDSLLSYTMVKDTETGDVIVKVVNLNTSERAVKIDVNGLAGSTHNARKTVLSGSLTDENSFEDNRNIVPQQTTVQVKDTWEYQAPAASLTVFRIDGIR